MYTLRTCFRTFGTDLHAPSMLIDKISASELKRMLVKSALLVGYSERIVFFSPLTDHFFHYSSKLNCTLVDFETELGLAPPLLTPRQECGCN